MGWGFGFTSVMLSYISGLSHATGPGLLEDPYCPGISVFYVMAFSHLGFVLLHFLFSFLAFDGYNRKSWWRPALVFFLHMLASVLVCNLFYSSYAEDNRCIV